MEARKINKLIVKLKYKAFDLREKGQLPSLLVSQIMKLGNDTPLEVYTFYMDQTKHLLRVSHYYKDYKFIEKETNENLKELLLQKGYYIN